MAREFNVWNDVNVMYSSDSSGTVYRKENVAENKVHKLTVWKTMNGMMMKKTNLIKFKDNNIVMKQIKNTVKKKIKLHKRYDEE